MAEQLGTAVLELDVDQKPLVRGLADSERRTAVSVAVMQAMLDSLHADLKISIAESVATAAGAQALPGRSGAIAGQAERAAASALWGVRGPTHAGSLQNPVVTVIEASKYAPMGSMAAAIGSSNVADEQGHSQSGLVSAVDLQTLSRAVSDLARESSAANRLAQAGAQGLAVAGIPEPATTAPSQIVEDPEGTMLMGQIVQSLGRLEKTMAAHPLLAAARTAAGSSTRDTLIGGPRPQGPSRTTIIESTDTTINQAPGAPTVLGARGGGSQTAPIPVVINRGGGSSAPIPVYLAPGGGGGGGGGVPPVALGGGGGGGGGIDWTRVLLGGGGRVPWLGAIAGTAAAGSLGSFAGLGPEHLLTTALGVLGSAGSGALGGGLLAAGSLGKLAVGGGSDAAVLKSTIADTQTLSKDYANLAQAQAIYGKNSRQAAVATAQLNSDMQTLGNTAGVKAEAGLAKATTALNTFWDLQTSGARVQAVAIMQQGVTLGHEYVPMIAQAAQRNLSIINSGLKPLFSWLQGPDGIGIFNNLENLFANELPMGVHAFDQAVELVMRIVNIAAGDTGGFVQHLDELLTRWNSMSNAQLGVAIQRYINDFHLWDTFVKLLIEDIYGLFHQDVGTGNSIIQTLNTALGKLREYEQSSRGQGQLTNIFMVHKTEVLDLIHVIGQLGSAFSSVYMAIAPTAVTAMNDVVLPVIKGIADAIAVVAHTSPLAADALGLLLVSFKAFGIGSTIGTLKSFFGWFTGAEAANAGAANADAAAQTRLAGSEVAAGGAGGIAGLAAKAGTGIETAGTALGAAGLGSALGGAAAIAIRAAIPALGAFFAERFVVGATGLSHLFDKTATATPGGTSTISSGKPTSILPGVLGQAENTFISAVGGLLGLGGGSTLNVQEVGKFANYTAGELAKLIVQMKAADSLKLNGTAVPKKQLIDLAQAALDAKDKIKFAVDEAKSSLNNWFINNSGSLRSLTDDFETHMRLIATTLGTNSDEGRKLVTENVNKMIAAVTQAMLNGKVSVTQGMAAINSALKQGVAAGAIDWKAQWTDIFDTYTHLWEGGKLTTSKYLSDVHSLVGTGFQAIKQNAVSIYHQMFEQMHTEEQRGIISHGQFVQDMKTADVAMVASERSNWQSFAQNTYDSMVATGKVTLSGARAIAGELNQMLKSVGAKQIPVPSGIAVSGLSAPGQGLHGGTNAAGGGVWQVGRPGQAGRDSVPLNVAGQQIMVGEGEKVAVINRHQAPDFDARFADWGGLGGYFAGNKKPHHMQTGGLVPGRGYSTGGLGSPGSSAAFPPGPVILDSGVNMSVGQEPQILADLRELAGELHNAVYVISGYRSPAHSVAVGGFANDPHTRGEAADIGIGGSSRSSMFAVAESLLRAVGLYRPFYPPDPNEVNHVQLLAGALQAAIGAGSGAGGAGAAQPVPTIQTPSVKGAGLLTTLVQAGLVKATDAANTYAQKHAGGAGGTGPAGNYKGPLNVTFTDPNQTISFAQAVDLHRQAGFSPIAAALFGHVATSESGLRPGVVNSIGATGLDQINVPVHQDLVARYGDMRNPWHNVEASKVLFDQSRMAPWLASRPAWGSYAPPGYAAGGLMKMYDATGGTLSSIPKDAQAIASYVDHYGGYGQARAMFPHLPVVGISVTPGNNVPADIYDVEPRGKTVAETIAAIAAGRAKGDYGGADDLGKIRAGLAAKGIGRASFKEWLAAWPGSGANVAGGYDAHQYASNAAFDTSVALPSFFSGVAGARSDATKKTHNKKVPKGKGPKPKALPKLKALPGMPKALSDLYNQLTGLDASSQGLIGWQGYIDQLHGGGTGTAVPLVTLADGTTQVVNWDGMKDPQTGLWDKGINQRLAEIGAPGNLDISTELGIDDQLLLDYFKMQGLAPQVGAGFGSVSPPAGWLGEMNAEVGIEGAEINWLDHVLDPQWPLSQTGEPKWPADRFSSMLVDSIKIDWPGHHYYTWSKSEPFATWIKSYVAKYKNQLASIKRWTEIRAGLAQKKAAIDARVTARFEAARHKLAIGGMTGTADAATILRDEQAALTADRTAALAGVQGSPPGSWLGDPAAWQLQAGQERAAITNEFAARALALRDAAAKAGLTGRVQKSNALAGLDAQEAAEKAALIQSFDDQRTDLGDQITGARTLSSGEHTYLSGLKTSIGSERTKDNSTIANATTGSIGTNLAAYTAPAQQGGQLAIHALTMANITIPSVLAEIAALKGTTLPSTPAGGLTQTQSELLALTQQQLATAGELAAVAELQLGTFQGLPNAPIPFAVGGLIPEGAMSSLPPFGGSFLTGGIVPGPVGAARTVIAHGGEPILPVGGDGASIGDVHLHFHGKARELRDLIDVRIDKRARTTARNVGRGLPGRGGGLVVR